MDPEEQETGWGGGDGHNSTSGSPGDQEPHGGDQIPGDQGLDPTGTRAWGGGGVRDQVPGASPSRRRMPGRGAHPGDPQTRSRRIHTPPALTPSPSPRLPAPSPSERGWGGRTPPALPLRCCCFRAVLVSQREENAETCPNQRSWHSGRVVRGRRRPKFGGFIRGGAWETNRKPEQKNRHRLSGRARGSQSRGGGNNPGVGGTHMRETGLVSFLKRSPPTGSSPRGKPAGNGPKRQRGVGWGRSWRGPRSPLMCRMSPRPLPLQRPHGETEARGDTQVTLGSPPAQPPPRPPAPDSSSFLTPAQPERNRSPQPRPPTPGPPGTPLTPRRL